MKKNYFLPSLLIALLLLQACNDQPISNESKDLAENDLKGSHSEILSQNNRIVKDRFLIAFNKNSKNNNELIEKIIERSSENVLHHIYDYPKGFAATLNSKSVEALKNNPNVKTIENDEVAMLDNVQNNAPWALDRIDQRNLPLDNVYNYFDDGDGVNIYVVDTGIRSNHNEFGGRVKSGASVIDDGRGTEDCDGHGTQVAGAAAGSTYGIAKAASIHPVRVYGCDPGNYYKK